jgi:hypothetical protein
VQQMPSASHADSARASGAALITSPLPLIIPAGSVQTVRVSAVAPSFGTLQIRGVALRLHDGSSTEVLLPIIDEAAKNKRDKRRSQLQIDTGKIKATGLDARSPIHVNAKRNSTLQAGKAGGEVDEQEKWLECEVVDEQPLVWIKKTNLTHGTVMLYHGER